MSPIHIDTTLCDEVARACRVEVRIEDHRGNSASFGPNGERGPEPPGGGFFDGASIPSDEPDPLRAPHRCVMNVDGAFELEVTPAEFVALAATRDEIATAMQRRGQADYHVVFAGPEMATGTRNPVVVGGAATYAIPGGPPIVASDGTKVRISRIEHHPSLYLAARIIT